MKFLLTSIFCLSVFFVLKAFSFLATHIHLYSCREAICIERIAKQQKACDILNAVHQVFVMLVCLYLAVVCMQLLFNLHSIMVINIVSIIVISLCYITYFVLRFKMETKYHLGNFYSNMIYYRLKQEVVTEDNDYEVTYIRSYKKVMNHKRSINILFLIAIATLLYRIFCV